MKLEHGHQTMTERGGGGILNDQGWKKRRMTVKFMDEEGAQRENPEAWRMLVKSLL